MALLPPSFLLLLGSLVTLALGLGPEDNRLQQELDMGSPSNLAATAVAAALEGEDDFGFEIGGGAANRDEESPSPAPLSASDTPSSFSEESMSAWPASNSRRVHRLWGIPDTSAVVGRFFSFAVPTDAFSGDVETYEASGLHGEVLPHWLLFKPVSGKFEGVATANDLGELYVKVQARGAEGDVARDVFAINVVPTMPKEQDQLSACPVGQDRVLVTILLDAQLKEINSRKKVSAVKNLAGFLGISPDTVHLEAQDSEKGISLHDESVVAAGAGNVQRPRTPMEPAVVLRFPSNCAAPGHPILTERLQSLARDGTLAEVLQLPVIGWLTQSTTPVQKSSNKVQSREKRETDGSGDYYDEYGEDEDDGDGDEDEEDDDDGGIPDTRVIPTMASPTFPEPTATTPRMQTVEHHHRHGHGEKPKEDEGGAYKGPVASSGIYASIVPTPVLVPLRPTRLPSPGRSLDLASSVYEPSIEPSRVGYDDYTPAPTPSVTPGILTTQEDYDEEEEDESVLHSSSVTHRPSTPHVTQPLPPATTTPQPLPETTTLLEPGSTEEGSSSSSRPRQEIIEFDSKNFSPRLVHRLKKIPTIAGKALRYTIPNDSFNDLEDGDTRNLRLIFKSGQGTAIPPNSWIQFNPETQEVYALPLEEQVSKWNFEVEAMDREGKTVSDSLEVVVQHHKGWRTVNHEFTLQLKIEQKFDFPSSVDWQLSVLSGLARFFSDPDESQITVINATSSMSSVDKVFFTWTNDSLPRNACDNVTLKQMYDAMTLNERGEPSMALKAALGEPFRIKHVSFRGLGQCELFTIGPPPAAGTSHGKPDSPAAPASPDAVEPLQNFAPVPRNQIDHINATVGHLLIFRVPEDAFYDPEDISTRNMKLTLLTMNRTPVDSDHWLQFDVKNQEFYGVPTDTDKGQEEYQLVCEDSGGLTATDGLVVVVHPAPSLPYNVEFRMTLSKPSVDDIEESASTKRRLVERIAQLFGDHDARNVVLGGIRPPPYQHVITGPSPSVEVSWYNKSLPRDECPEEQVAALRRMLVSEEAQGHGHSTLPQNSLGGRVFEIMKSDFPVMRLTLVPTGLCQGGLTFLHAPSSPEPPTDDEIASFGSTTSSDEYLITYIVPAVVIAAMLLLAGLVACALYRRNRRGKLAVGESGFGTPGFRTRGIPVILQDELDEKATEPVAKSPVIMKNEKPPLPPPEYPQHAGIPSSGATPHATPPMHPHHRQPTAEDPLLSEEPEASPYQPPPPFTSNRDTGRQNRPKPTPTYRKPPPYVPP